MAKRHGGLGRGLDALIPQVIPMYPAEQGQGSAGGPREGTGTEVFFSDEEEEKPSIAEESPVKYIPAEPPVQKIEPEPVQEQEPPQEEPAAAPAAAESKEEAPKPAQEAENAAAVTVRISQVEPNRSQPRQVFDEEALEELAASIRQYGILQPILVQDRGDHYEIIAGERRWRAAIKAGLREVPVVIRSYSEQEIMELSLIENIQRQDLNPIEEAEAYSRLIEEFGLKQEEIAERVSKSRTAVTNSLRLLKLDPRVRQMLTDKTLSMGQARALLALTIPEEQYLTAKEVAEKGLSVRDVEKLIRSKTSGSRQKKKPVKAQPDPQLAAIYRDLEERIREKLQTQVRILDQGGGWGHLEIDFYGSQDLERLIDKFV